MVTNKSNPKVLEDYYYNQVLKAYADFLIPHINFNYTIKYRPIKIEAKKI